MLCKTCYLRKLETKGALGDSGLGGGGGSWVRYFKRVVEERPLLAAGA